MSIDKSIRKARKSLLSKQNSNGYWQFPLEADCTMPAEYILLQHFLGKKVWQEDKLVLYIHNRQNEDGGWPLYDGSGSDLSCSVKCYYALKLCGYDYNHPLLTKAKLFILSKGGAEKSNVFTRIMLALFQQVSWETIPWTPQELILLPKSSPFNIHKVAYWSRTVMLPLSVLVSNRAEAVNPSGTAVRELFIYNPWVYDGYFTHTKGIRPNLILKAEKFLRRYSKMIDSKWGAEAGWEIARWIKERQSASDGLGGIFPAMAGFRMALRYLALPCKSDIEDDLEQNIRDLFVIGETEAYVQPCISPVWDTSIAMLAISESEDLVMSSSVWTAAEWLKSKQIKITGDWIESANIDLKLPLNGWAFQNKNDHYPDVDDTAMVIMALEKIPGYDYEITCARTWLTAMQSKNGGYGAFDANNDHHWINDIPFADHGAMLDPPTADVSGRVLWANGSMPSSKYYSRKKLVKFILKEQNDQHFWWGRWGTNYLWGTWSAVMGLKQDYKEKAVRDALVSAGVSLMRFQLKDGGYGESNESYGSSNGIVLAEEANAFHTSLALLTMCDIHNAALYWSQEFHDAARLASKWLIINQSEDGTWQTHGHNAPGFPKVFYLKYHGYAHYFPLWALSRYRNVFK